MSARVRLLRRLPVVFGMVVACVLMFAASAYAGIVSLHAPLPAHGATSISANVDLSIQATSTATIPAPQTIRVDGTSLSVSASYRETSGHWEDDGCDTIWVPDTWDFSDITLSARALGLADGAHVASAEVVDSEGGSATLSWPFTVAQKPTISGVSPLTSSSTTTPLIRVPFSDNGGTHTCVLVVGGQTVPTTQVGSEFHGTVTQPLPAGTNVAASATVTDQNGNATTYSWSFVVAGSGQVTAVLTPALGAVVNTSRPYVSCIASSAIGVSTIQFSVDGASNITMVPNVLDPTHFRVGYYPTLADGSHVALAGVNLVGGGVANFTTSFTVSEPPIINWITPAAGTRTSDSTPFIYVRFVDNLPASHTAEMKIDGVSVTPVVEPNMVSYQPLEPLAVDANHTIWVLIRDAAGNEVTTSSTFWIDKYGIMPVSDCVECHTVYPQPHIDRECQSCHADVDSSCAGDGCHDHDFSYCMGCHGDVPTSGHETVAGDPHNSTTDFTTCKRCHNVSLTREHNRYSTAGINLNCMTCHSATASAAVQNAIATNNTACAACHTDVNHEALHISPTADGCFVSGCHASTKNLADVHEPYVGPGSTHPEYTDSCGLCHDNPAVDTSSANAACTPVCHSATVHPHPAALLAGRSANGERLCTDCHSDDLLTEHAKPTSDGSADPCGSCHDSGGPREQIDGAWDRTCDTPECHGLQGSRPVHATYCQGCHTPDGEGDFASSATDFSADPAVDRSTACPKCHLSVFAGTHPYHFRSGYCGATCHPSGWGASAISAVPLVPTPFGSFNTIGSAEQTAGVLHRIHSLARWPSTASTASSHCASCHAVASCTACHRGGVSTSHGAHGAVGNSDKGAVSGWNGLVAEGVVDGDQSRVTEHAETTRCGAAQCHGGLRTGEGAPRIVEDRTTAQGVVTKAGTWKDLYSTNYTAGRATSGMTSGATLSTTFDGTRVVMVGDTGVARGIAEIYIDGSLVSSPDLYSATSRYQQVLFDSGQLSQGSHTVMIKVTGRRNTKSSSIAVAVDQFKVYSTPEPPVVPRCSSCHPARVGSHGPALLSPQGLGIETLRIW